MRGYLAKTIFVIFCISFFHFFSIPSARSEDPGLMIGGFQWGGSVELGYRLTDIDGRERYKEVVNLMKRRVLSITSVLIQTVLETLFPRAGWRSKRTRPMISPPLTGNLSISSI